MSSAYGSKSSSPSSSLKGVKASATATAGASRPSSRSSDPYYGHDGTSVLCARFITALFQCPHIPTDTKPCVPPPPLAHFVAYALFRTRLPSIVTFAALLLLQRLKIRIPTVRGSSGHRLFISAFMIASKVLCDETYSNQSWGIVAQEMFVLKELNQMEREMCGFLEWNLNVLGEEVIEFEASVRAEYGVEAPVKASCPASTATHFVVPKVNVCRTPRDQSWPLLTVPTCAFPLHGIADVGTAAPSRIIYIAHPPPAAVLQNDSPPPPHFTSAESSIVSSPASEDCKTPSPFAATAEMRRTSEGDYCGVCQHELA
ncbi:hypothetical protein EHS25_000919 [Saitozyma podzolica]|uniref:Cyclin N-terminal domain-containing protein n=1 Tax=Saitozyma podzolica TaxID=1890683 RepID=A0A427YXL8_9TREE|nr:hypothetical protein EHS25_000919 [Saitozyma podzolica]